MTISTLNIMRIIRLMFGIFDISVKLASEKTKIPLLGVLLANIIKDVVKPSTLPTLAPA